MSHRTINFDNRRLDLVFPKSTHTNPLRQLQREMAARERRSVRPADIRYDAAGQAVNPLRRQKTALRRKWDKLGSGRAWVRLRKAFARADRDADRAAEAR